MTWVKRNSVLRLVGGAAVLWLLIHFAFDPLLKFSLKKAGTAAAGAQVDIASVRSRWRLGRLDVLGLAVADKHAPMTNLLEASRLGFTLDVSAALRGKAVIREASIEGLRFGTPRKTSGALAHPAPPSAFEAELTAQLTAAPGAALNAATRATGNPAEKIDAAKLQSLNKLDEAKTKAREIEDRWRGKQSEANQIAQDAKQLAEDVKSLGRGTLLQNAQKASQTQKKLKDLIARVDAQRDQAKKDLAQIEDVYRQADDLRHKDINGLLSAAGLPSLDTQDLARRLLGAQTAARLDTALHWMRWAREKAAARQAAAAKAPPPPARRKGLTIEFPRAHSYPQFLLENAKLTGRLDDLSRGRGLDVAGLLTGVTSNPALYGKPAILALSGAASSGEGIKFSAEVEQQKTPVGVVARFHGAGFSLAGGSLGDGEVGGEFADGRAEVDGEVRCAGDDWKGEIIVTAVDVKLRPNVKLSGIAGQAVSDALGSVKGFRVRVGLSGKEGHLKLAFSSDIADVMAGAMKKAFAGQIEAQRKVVEAKVAQLYDAQLQSARGQTNALASKILGPLDAQRAALDRQLQDALKKSIGSPPNLKKLFR